MNSNLKKATELFLNKINNTDELSENILTRVVIQSLDKFQNKISVGLQDSISDLLNVFKKDIQQELFNYVDNYSLDKEKILFPKNCRFVYAKGETKVLVIEQEPCLRNIILEQSIINDSFVENKTTIRLPLLIPYSIFIFQFKNNKLVNSYNVWKKEPLSSLQDKVCNPILPNIHKNYLICLGNILNPYLDLSISDTCNTVISNFWQSVFNSDLSHFWWSKNKFDNIKSALIWSKNSNDPFLFQNIDLPTNHQTLEDIIKLCFVNEKEIDAVLVRKQIGEKIDVCVEKMFSSLMKYFKNTKFDKFYPKDVKQTLTDSINSINEEISEFLLSMQKDLIKLKEPNIRIVNQKKFWKPYKEPKNE